MTKLICINSQGPMGSALLGGFVEQFGVVNVPVRQFGLSEYLLGRHALDSGAMQEHVAQWVSRYSRPIRLGGVNVLDRDSQQSRALSDLERVRSDLEDIRQREYGSLDELYRACMAVFCKSIIYKNVSSDNDTFIDYPLDFGDYVDRARELYDAYQKSFDDVRMIHLHRDFEGWINAVAVQKFSKRQLGERFSFRLKSWVKKYYNYEKAVSELPGLHLDFHDLFPARIEDLAERVGSFIGEPANACDWRNAEYDLYGKFVHFDQAFTPVDDDNVYLDRFSRRYFARHASHPNQVGFKEKLTARLLYLWCYLKFKVRPLLKS